MDLKERWEVPWMIYKVGGDYFVPSIEFNLAFLASISEEFKVEADRIRFAMMFGGLTSTCFVKELTNGQTIVSIPAGEMKYVRCATDIPDNYVPATLSPYLRKPDYLRKLDNGWREYL